MRLTVEIEPQLAKLTDAQIAEIADRHERHRDVVAKALKDDSALDGPQQVALHWADKDRALLLAHINS